MKTIIEMARQVGYPIQHDEWRKATEEFDALVRADERERLLVGVEMPEPVAHVDDQGIIYEQGELLIYPGEKLVTADQLRETVAAAVAREREECAKVFESIQKDSTVPPVYFSLADVAKIIRAGRQA